MFSVGVTDRLVWTARRSNLKRGPYGSEDDFAIPTPAKLTRVEEPKRGALVHISGGSFQVEVNSDSVKSMNCSNQPCLA